MVFEDIFEHFGRRDLRADLLMTARRDDDQIRARPDAFEDRVVGRRVAGVQRDQNINIFHVKITNPTVDEF